MAPAKSIASTQENTRASTAAGAGPGQVPQGWCWNGRRGAACPKTLERSGQDMQATPRPVVRCKHLLKISAVLHRVCEVRGSPQALVHPGGNQGMYKHLPEQPTPYLCLQTACVILGMISVPSNSREQPQTPLLRLPGCPTHPAEIILTCRVQGESSPDSSRKQRNIHFPTSAAPRALSEPPDAVSVCSPTPLQEK